MTDNLVERLLAYRDQTGHLPGVCFDAARDLSRLQEALAAAEVERDEERRIRRDMAERFFLPLGEPEPDPASLPALLAETRKKAPEEAAAIENRPPRTLGEAMLESPFKAVERYRAAIRALSQEQSK